MRVTIREMADKYWEGCFPGLMQVVDETLRKLENFLVLEDYHKNMRGKESRLGKSFGGFGSDSLDMKALSSVLGKGHQARGMQKERSLRMRKIFAELESIRDSYQAERPPVGHAELKDEVKPILEAFDAHIQGGSKLFSLIRRAQLEAKGRYTEDEHSAYFESFSWREMDTEEMSLCPPFLVYTEPQSHFGDQLGSLIDLVARGYPIKVVLSQAVLGNGSGPNSSNGETGRAAGLQSLPDAGLLFLSLRHVYFMQHSGADTEGLAEGIKQGLESPRPSVFSILANPGKEGLHERAALARQSRAFPHFTFDPDRASDFVSCLDVSDNPDAEALWPIRPLEHLDESGNPASMDRPFTPADFAVEEAKAKGDSGELGPLDEETDGASALPLSEYLEESPTQRRDKTPFVYGVNGDGGLIRLVPTRSLVAKVADRLEVWHTLQELSGIGNPYVQAAERRLRESLSEEREAAISAQRVELEAQSREREQVVVSDAMRQLAQRLTGQLAPVGSPGNGIAVGESIPASAPVGGDVPAPPSGSSSEPASEAAPAAPSGEEGPWLEQSLCTSCDECTDLNKNIFAYDSSKKAYIKDASGGPYRDIVKSAEKCSSGAIHPGAPLDPNEKDVEKWIKRAEPYQ